MEQPVKQFYEAPSTTVFEVRWEGVLCASGGTEQFRGGNSYGDSDFD